MRPMLSFFFFFFNDTATTEIYTLSLHDALPIFLGGELVRHAAERVAAGGVHEDVDPSERADRLDRKSTRLNSSHDQISYAVFCLKKKKHVPLSSSSPQRLIQLYAHHTRLARQHD